MKSILVIGNGKFGHHLCKRLMELKNEVMVIDETEENINDIMPIVTSAMVADCTNPEVLKSIGIGNFDIVIVCIGEDFQNSLEITDLVKENGAKYVISMASRDIQAKFLLKNGADEVFYPNRDIAYNLAAKCSANHVFDYIEITDEYAIYEIPIVDSWVGRNIRDINVRVEYDISIIAVISNGETIIMPPADYIFNSGDHIKVLGKQEKVNKLIKKL